MAPMAPHSMYPDTPLAPLFHFGTPTTLYTYQSLSPCTSQLPLHSRQDIDSIFCRLKFANWLYTQEGVKIMDKAIFKQKQEDLC